MSPKAVDTQPSVKDVAQVAQSLNRLIHQDSLYGLESPIERAMEVLGDKYVFQIVYILQQFDQQRFAELEQQISGISPRTLSARLKHLEKFGIVHREQFPTIPPRVEYSLTDRGRDLAGTLSQLRDWANQWFPYSPA
ncbi:MAG: helix-turn-helix transcriptional regulator [Vampirovibrio sp.]|nr:helix-turn-helix transcriptional regulator [Vampirovibrio sp.]